MTDSSIQGLVETVENGTVFCRIYVEGDDNAYCGEIPITEIPECQRVDLGIGSIFTLVNGYVLICKTMWTTKELEDARDEAQRLFKALGWDLPRPFIQE